LPAKAASLALQCLWLHPGFGYRHAWEYGREPCAESQAFLCSAAYFWSTTGREPCGGYAPTGIFPGALLPYRPPVHRTVCLEYQPRVSPGHKDTNQLKKKEHDSVSIRANAAGPLSVSGSAMRLGQDWLGIAYRGLLSERCRGCIIGSLGSNGPVQCGRDEFEKE
jgi:hypothetical protein